MCGRIRSLPLHRRRHPFRLPIPLSLVLAALLCLAGAAQAQQTFFIDTVAGPRGLYAYRPNSVAVASDGTVYMSDPTHNSVFTVADDGTLLPFAGPGEGQAGFGGKDGPAAAAQLGGPSGIAVASDGTVYIADRLNHRIRKVDATTRFITTVAGTGTSGDSGDNGQATAAQLNQPIGVTVTSDGTLYIADAFNHRVRKVDGTTGLITTVAGDGTGGYSGDNGQADAAQLFYPTGVAVASDGTMYIADWNNHRVRKVASDGTITTVAGDGTGGYSGDNGQADAAQLNNPYGVLVTADGNTVYIADWNNHRVRKVDVSIATPTITTVAGTGTQDDGGDGGLATEADLNWPTGVAVDTAGSLYIAFNGTNRQGGVRKVDTAGIITTLTGGIFPGFSGDGGLATEARLSGPTDVVVDGAGNLYIADRTNYRIRQDRLQRPGSSPQSRAGTRPATRKISTARCSRRKASAATATRQPPPSSVYPWAWHSLRMTAPSTLSMRTTTASARWCWPPESLPRSQGRGPRTTKTLAASAATIWMRPWPNSTILRVWRWTVPAISTSPIQRITASAR